MTTKEMIERLEEYTLAPLTGNNQTRRTVIFKDLKKGGLEPWIDDFGNIWVQKGQNNGYRTIVLSSHMDTAKTEKDDYFFGRTAGGKLAGLLDNSLGCALNAHAALTINPKTKVYHVFTVDEESLSFQNGAKKVIDKLFDTDDSPIVITLDVTSSHYSSSSSANNSGKKYVNIENVTPSENARMLEKIGLDKSVYVKYGHDDNDESKIYGEFFTAFSICPIIKGNMHETSQITPKALTESYALLSKILLSPETINTLIPPLNTSHMKSVIKSVNERLQSMGYGYISTLFEEKGTKSYFLFPEVLPPDVQELVRILGKDWLLKNYNTLDGQNLNFGIMKFEMEKKSDTSTVTVINVDPTTTAGKPDENSELPFKYSLKLHYFGPAEHLQTYKSRLNGIQGISSSESSNLFEVYFEDPKLFAPNVIITSLPAHLSQILSLSKT